MLPPQQNVGAATPLRISVKVWCLSVLSQLPQMLGETATNVVEAMPYLLAGAGVTIVTVICAMLFGLIFGVPFAVLQVYGPSYARRFVALYAWFFRGVPILVLLYLVYFGLAYQFALDISPFVASCLVLGLTSTAYQSQIFRGSFSAIAQGQMKAAHALGMSTPSAIWSIMLPQVMRISIPGWSNEYSILLKDSVLISVLGTAELMARTKHVAARTADFAVFYCVAALLYFIITYVGVRLLHRLEKRLHIPGYTHM